MCGTQPKPVSVYEYSRATTAINSRLLRIRGVSRLGGKIKQSKHTIANTVVPKRHVIPSKRHHPCPVLDVKIVQASPLQRGLLSVVPAARTVRYSVNGILVSIQVISGRFLSLPRRSNSIERRGEPEVTNALHCVIEET